jgi:hypothetical protein
MRKGLCTRVLVVRIIFLFVVTSISPSLAQSISKKSSAMLNHGQENLPNYLKGNVGFTAERYEGEYLFCPYCQ